MRRPGFDGSVGRSRDQRLVVVTEQDVVTPIGMTLDTLPKGGRGDLVEMELIDLKPLIEGYFEI